MADGHGVPVGPDNIEFDIDTADAFLVDVDGFEGPLHLLLTLARRQKVDLKRVSVLDLAEQYLAFIADARDKRIDLAADYLLMAAWLAFLKSKLLLPKPEKTDKSEGVDPEDLAARLAFRLQRLEAMRQASAELMDGHILGRDVFPRGLPEQPKVIKRAHYNTRLIDLMAAFANIQTRKTKVRPHEVVKQMVLPLEKARDVLKDLPEENSEWRALDSVLPELDAATGDRELPRSSRLASLFAASLDLAKVGTLDLRQDDYRHPLMVKRIAGGAEAEAAHAD